MNTAVFLSLLFHALLLSMAIGGDHLGLPGLNFPWKERRFGTSDLQVKLADVQPPPPAVAPVPFPDYTLPPAPVARTSPAPVAKAEPVTAAPKLPDIALPVAAAAPQVRARAEAVAPTPVAAEPEPKKVDEEAQARALEQAKLDRERQAAEQQRHTELKAEAARQEQQRQETARADDLARQEAQKKEQARLAAEKAQQDAIRQEHERAEGARLEAARKETARLEAIKQAQQEAARQAQAEAARAEAAKQESARAAQAKIDAAAKEKAAYEAQREQRLRDIGKQLDEERARRDAAAGLKPGQLPTQSTQRRGWLFGRADANKDMALYAEALSKKIEMNMTFDMVRELVKQPHSRPMVTMSIRADGTVEKVSFESSTGIPALDEAIRKVIASQAPYGKFPPNLAAQFDVIDIRRTWVFDMAIRLQ